MKTNTQNNAQTTDIFNAIATSNARFEDWTDEDIWGEYRTAPTNRLKDEALAELLFRHNGMLSKLAHHMTNYYAHCASFEDFFQNARLGAIKAYNRYDIYKISDDGKKASLATYTYTTVETFLLSCIDEESFIRCPAQKRAYRAYFAGRYDNNPVKKEEFEKKNGLTSPEKIAEAREKYRLLQAEVTSLDAHLTTDNGEVMKEDFSGLFAETRNESDVDILDRVAWDETVDSLKPFDQMVYKTFFVERYTVKQIVAMVEKISGKEIEEKDVQDAVKRVRNTFRKRHEDLAEGRKKHQNAAA